MALDELDNSRFSFFLLWSGCLLLSTVSFHAQPLTAESDTPLAITALETTQPREGVHRVSLKFRNAADRGISAVVLVLIPEHPDPEASKTLQRTMIVGRLIPTMDAPARAPGETWEWSRTMGWAAYKGVPHTGNYRVLVDLVLFDDGTLWGPGKSYQHLKLDGLHLGCLLERQRLKRLMETQGVEALLQDLERAEVNRLRLGQTARPLREKDGRIRSP